MRIGVFDPYLDDGGGGEKYMLTLASCLAADNDVTLLWNEPSDLNRVNQRFNIDLSKVKMAPNFLSSKVPQIKRIKESRSYDALIVLSDGSIPLVLSKKLFLHVQQPIGLARRNLKNVIKLSRVSKVFCNSNYSKSFVDRQLGVNSAVIYPPVELHPKNVSRENIILHVGRFRAANIGISDYKKQDVMAQVFKEMVKNGLSNWKFILAVGVNEVERAPFELFKQKAADVNIEFAVNKTNDELWDLYSRAKIYWHASGYGENLEEHPEYAEHFGISTVEAMGAGCVPVVINSGGQKEIVEDGKNGLLWNTLEELAAKTKSLIDNPSMMESLSLQAKVRATDFSKEKFCESVKSLIKNG